jgi:hypothetical protein
VIDERSPSPVRDAATGWGRDAAERFHEYPGPIGQPSSS